MEDTFEMQLMPVMKDYFKLLNELEGQYQRGLITFNEKVLKQADLITKNAMLVFEITTIEFAGRLHE